MASRSEVNTAHDEGQAAVAGKDDSLAGKLEPIFNRWVRETTEKLGAMTAAASWSKPDVDVLINRTQAEALLAEVLEPWRADVLRIVMGQMLGHWGLSFDVKNPLVQGVLAQLGQNIVGITEEFRQDVMLRIDEAWNLGLSIDDAKYLLQSEVGGLTASRAERISRTELGAAVNGGSLASVRIAGVSKYKTWLATDDGRTRQTHRDADGQTRTLVQGFQVGDSSLQWPCDPFGAAKETVQCRCTLLYGDDPAGEPTTLLASSNRRTP